VAGMTFSALSILSGCASNQIGPVRPVPIEGDVTFVSPLAYPNLNDFVVLPSPAQAEARNQILTARMYIADMEYHSYEANLTREMQNEGLAATLASLGLSTSATLFAAAYTKTVLSAANAAVTGADQAYDRKELLSNQMQALQTQMRADRKTQAAVIYAKMYKDTGTSARIPTAIGEYTLPMALSDADAYYQAGTITSALVGLMKTVTIAETNADLAKSQAGPNPVAVMNVTTTATPMSAAVQGAINGATTRITSPQTQLSRFHGVHTQPGDAGIVIASKRISCMEKAVGLKDQTGVADPATTAAFIKFLGKNKNQTEMTPGDWITMEEAFPQCRILKLK
jgi:hypothetical protein